MKDKSAVDFQRFFNVYPQFTPKYHRTFSAFTALTAYYETVATCNDGRH